MPLFEYTCRKCQHTFEALVSTRTAQSTRCPECESQELDQLLALPTAGRATEQQPATNCRGDGPPCGAAWCGRKN